MPRVPSAHRRRLLRKALRRPPYVVCPYRRQLTSRLGQPLGEPALGFVWLGVWALAALPDVSPLIAVGSQHGARRCAADTSLRRGSGLPRLFLPREAVSSRRSSRDRLGQPSTPLLARLGAFELCLRFLSIRNEAQKQLSFFAQRTYEDGRALLWLAKQMTRSRRS